MGWTEWTEWTEHWDRQSFVGPAPSPVIWPTAVLGHPPEWLGRWDAAGCRVYIAGDFLWARNADAASCLIAAAAMVST